MSALHDYIRNVLERGDNRTEGDHDAKGDEAPGGIIEYDLAALNEVIDLHTERIAKHIQDSANKVKDDIDKRKKVTVHNYLGNIRFECTVVIPKSLQEVMQVMVQAKKEKKIVRAVGAFHAWSPVCVTPDYLVKTDGLVGTTRTPSDALKDPNASIYYDVLCGTSWKQAAVALEKEDRALMNIGGYSGLRILGATSTGTHGSGIKIPPLAGMIRGVTLVSAKFDADGLPILYRVEPTNGITDPHKHSGPTVLIQDDKTFNAMIVGLGAFGVVYSVTIETVPYYYVRETRELADWSKVKELLNQGPNGNILKYHNAEIWMNTYTNHALITRREVIHTVPKEQPLKSSTSSFAALIDQLPALKKLSQSLETEESNIRDDLIRELGLILAVFLKHFPSLVPFGMNLALNSQYHKDPKIGKYYDIYDIGFSSRFPAICIEISYPMSTYIAATDSAIKWFQSEQKKNPLQALVGFLSLRFTAGTTANLSMSYEPDPATSPGRNYLEIFSLFAFYKSVQGFEDLVGPVQEDGIKNFGGRLHWGQYLTPKFAAHQYKDRDPEFHASISEFKKIAKNFDPDSIMVNHFMDSTIFSVV